MDVLLRLSLQDSPHMSQSFYLGYQFNLCMTGFLRSQSVFYGFSSPFLDEGNCGIKVNI